MPYRRVGKVVYVKKGGKWKKKGESKTESMAEKYIKVLYMKSKGK